MYIFGINGVALAGKDTFAQKVNLYTPETIAVISTIDPVKQYYSSIGWDGSKLPEHRKVLNVLKRMWILGHIRIANCATPYDWVIKQCKIHEGDKVKAVFVMVREYEEMIKIKEIGDKWFDCGKTIRIVRDGLSVPLVEQEFIDSHPQNYMYDFTIMNPTTKDKSLPLLSDAAAEFATLLERESIDFEPLLWHPQFGTFVHPTIRTQIY